MGNLLAGFVKGATDYVLTDLDRRKLMEAEEKKLRTLEQLRRETAEWEEKLPSKVQARKESESRIAENAAQAERDKRRLDLTEQDNRFQQGLALRNQSRMEADSADERRYRAESLKLRKQGLDGTGTDTTAGDSASRVADALKTRYKSTIDTLIEDDVDPLTINQYALKFVQNPNVRGNLKGAALEDAFLDGLNRLRFNDKAQKSRYE